MMESEDQNDVVDLDGYRRKALKMHRQKDTLAKISMISRAACGRQTPLSSIGKRLNEVRSHSIHHNEESYDQ